MKKRVADYIADFLINKGIKDIFTITGGGAMYLNNAFGHNSKIFCIYNHNEQACAMAAEAYARYSGNIAAVCVTSGPGGTNAITGVLGGWLDSIPMLIISGQVKFLTTAKSTRIPLRQLGDQEFNIVDTVKTMTKISGMIINPNDIAYMLEKYLYIAQNGRPGPVWLDVPLDIQGAIIDTELLRHYNPIENPEETPPPFTQRKAKEIVEKIASARRPVILAGTAIISSKAHCEFLQLIDKLQIPVVTAWNAHDVLWNDHPLFCGRPGTVGDRGGNFVVQNSDLLLVLGSRLNIRQISYNWESFAPDSYKIMVDIDPGELIKPTLDIDFPVYANVKDVISLINKLPLPKMNHTRWLSWSKDINEKYPVCLTNYKNVKSPINPYVFIDTLFKVLEEGDAIVTSNGSACVCSFQAAIIKKNQRLFTNSGCASMGYGLPAALGVAVIRKDKRTICIEGDGSIQMNIHELQTIYHHNMNNKIFILNNNGYHSIRQTQENLFSYPLCGVCKENGVSFPEIVNIAAAYKLPYYKIDNIQNMDNQLYNIINTKGPALIECIIDETQYFCPKVSSRKMPDGNMISTELDNMFPFLQEYETNSIKDEIINI